MSRDLAAWLLEQIAKDEYAERLFRNAYFMSARNTVWNLARVLAECEAKRRMIALHRPVEVAIGDGAEQRRGVVCWHCIGPGGRPVSGDWIERADAVLWPCTNMRLLALPYAGRPGYPKEWRP